VRIEYKRKAVKYIDSCDRNTQQRLKTAIEKDEPLPDELEAIAEAKADTSETIPHEAINWK